MSSRKRKSEEDPTASAVALDGASKKRRRVSDAADESAPRVEKKSKKDKKDKKEKKDKKSKKSSKKDKRSSAPDEDMAEPDAVEEAVAPGADEPSDETPAAEAAPTATEAEAETEKPAKKSKKDKKDKKEKKDKKSKKDKKPKSSSTSDPTTTTDAPPSADTSAPDSTTDGKKSRFIVFVGNLPYSATVPQISAHFAAVHPTSVRLLHDPRTHKSRGVAFVEFAGYDHMKTCLKTMHHSTFACPSAGGGRAPEERRINVELTAGGGGNTAHRKDKIRAKNEKLNEERARRAEQELEAKAEKEREKAAKGEGAQEAKRTIEDSIHPSRRRQVPS